MTLMKVNNRPAKTWNGLVNELFADFDQAFTRLAAANNVLPAVNIVETEDAYHLEMQAPGRKKENFTLQLENDQLTLGYEDSTQTENTQYKTVRREFSVTNFKRVFNLGDTVNAEGIAAKYEDGLLKVYLPKKEEVKPQTKMITIQ